MRLLVPGWFGTNSTKWLSKITLQAARAAGPYTTTFYNEPDHEAGSGAMKPVWQAEPNSMIVRPTPGQTINGRDVCITGWTWHDCEIKQLDVSIDELAEWWPAIVEPRVDFGWQAFRLNMELAPGAHVVYSRATAQDGAQQPLEGRRNHCRTVAITVLEP